MAGRDQSQDQRREAARRKRLPAPQVKTESALPIFGTPVKSDNRDDLSRSVQNTLGLYDNFKAKPHDGGSLFGVQYQPQTPLPGDSKNISHFPVINGQTRPHSSQGSGSGKSGTQARSSPADGPSSHRHGSSKAAPAGGSVPSKSTKRESGSASQPSSSSTAGSSSSSSHNKSARSSSHDRAKDSNQRRSKDGTPIVRPPSKPPSSTESGSSQSKSSSSSSQLSKSDGMLSSSSSTSKQGSARPSTNSAGRGSSSSSSSNSNASDSKMVLHSNGLLTETCHSITNYPSQSNSTKGEQNEKRQGNGGSKKDSSSVGNLPFISPMPDIITDFQVRTAPNPSREGKKERDADAKQRPRLDIPKKGSHQGHSKHKEVEKIFEKMTALKTPVSAIQTPVKAEAPKFPFDNVQHSSQITVPRKKLVDSINKDAEKKCSKDNQEGKGSSLRNDLRLSDESENEEAQETTSRISNSSKACEDTSSHSSQRQSSEMKRPADLESSGSESDAEEENTSESEESEESESDADTPPPSPPSKPKKSYSLMNQIRKVQKEMPQMPQMAPSTPSFRPPSVENPLSNSRLDPNDSSKHPELSAESGDNDDNDSFSKYNNSQPPSFTDFHQLSERSPLSKSSPKLKGSSKPTVKRPQARTDNSSSLKSSSAKDTTSSPRVKSESSNNKDSAKLKGSKQSSKSATSQNKKSPGPGGGGKSSAKPQERKTTGGRGKPSEKKRVIKSNPFIESDSDSDEDERTRSRPSSKAAVNTSTSSTSSSGSSSSSNLDTSYSVRQPKEPESGKRMPGIKKGDTTKYNVKPEPLDNYDHRRPPFDDFAHMDPIVSPIRGFMDEQSHTLDRHPEIKFDKDGKPSVYVRLKRDLFDHLPKSSVIKFEQSVPGTSTQKRKDSTDPPEKPSAIVKPVKRKQTELEKEKSGNKRSRLENKSPRRMREEALRGVRDEPTETLEPFVSSESALDRRQSSDRRGSVSSMTSQQSTHSSRRVKNDCDPHHPSSRSKRESSGRSRDFASQRIHDWTSPERHADRSVEMNVALGGGEGDAPASSHRSSALSHSHSHSLPPHTHHSTASHPHRGVEGEDWRVFPPADSFQGYGDEAQTRHRLELDERQFTADDYLAEGKKLKHLADTQDDKHAKALTYFEAVVYLTSCGNVFELDPHTPDDKAVTMYSDTCEIIRFILKLKGIHNGQPGNSNDNKLAVLCYRCQALLNMHMFKLKRQSAMNLSRALTDHLKGTSSKPQPPLQQNPSSWNPSSRYTGTPSPVSPTPSPAGSVGSACSMGSQGSASSDLVPSQTSGSGPGAPPTGPGSKLCNGLNPQSSTVAMPQHIVRIMSQFLTYSNYSLYSLQYWEQADILAEENKDFFRELARDCGELTLHSSTQDLVHYVRRGLSNLRRL